MKIVTYIVIGLLVVALGGGAYLFFTVHQPMAAEYETLKSGKPELEIARKELGKFRAKEKQDSGWTGPVADALRKGLAAELAAGKAEVVTAGNRVVVNIAEEVLYTPKSITFARTGQQNLANLAALLKEIKDKEIVVGNMTQPAPAQGRGRKRVPAKDARTLAMGRSMELVKYLEKNGVPSEALIAASYPAKTPDRGFKLKEMKTVIVIAAPAAASPEAAAPKAASAPQPTAAPATKPSATAATKPTPTATTAAPAVPGQLKSIPISTVPPKTVP